MTATIALVQHKGGTGKSSTTLNLGAALAALGQHVLIMDLDPQADLTAGLGIPVDEAPDKSVYKVLVSDAGTLRDVIIRTEWTNMDIVPGLLDMADLELSLAPRHGRERVLRKALNPIRGRYDFILMDCPPSLGLITVNALMAADTVLVPVRAQPRTIRAIERVLKAVTLARNDLDHDSLDILGVLLTMTDASALASRETISAVRELYGDLVFTTEIPYRTKVSEDVLWHAPLLSFAPQNDAAVAYRSLAAEVLRRLGVAIPEVAHAR